MDSVGKTCEVKKIDKPVDDDETRETDNDSKNQSKLERRPKNQ
jgi:hypothetical protein